MDKRLLKEQEKFKAVFQNASLGILVIDESGTITLVNDFLVKLFGYNSQAEIIGHTLEVLIPKRYHHQHVKQRAHFKDHPATRPMGMGRDLYGVTKDGTELPLEISLSSYTNDEGVFSIAFISDIRTRKDAEIKLQEKGLELAAINEKVELLNQELEKKVEARTSSLLETLKKLEASKEEISRALRKEKELNELKSAFVSMASHEFRTPLSTVLSSASLLSKYTLSEDQQKREKHILRIKSSVINLNNILNEFLSLKKIEEGILHINRSSVNIKSLIHRQINEMAEIFKSGQQVHYAHSGNEDILIDSVLFTNILINLLSNAAKFSADYTPIFIQTTTSSGKFEFCIKDQGIGISKKDQRHLFEMFFRASNAVNVNGTGLGLHIVSKYVEMMEGTIELKSVLNEGTEISIIFAQ